MAYLADDSDVETEAQHCGEYVMSKVTRDEEQKATELGLGLEELIRRGAGELIQQAIETELGALLSRYGNVSTVDGQRAMVRNGYLPECEVLTAVSPVSVRVPKVRDRSGSGVKFNAAVVPP